jgi:hypothetical protein
VSDGEGGRVREHSHPDGAAISSVLPIRPIGSCAITAARSSGMRLAPRIAVSTIPAGGSHTSTPALLKAMSRCANASTDLASAAFTSSRASRHTGWLANARRVPRLCGRFRGGARRCWPGGQATRRTSVSSPGPVREASESGSNELRAACMMAGFTADQGGWRRSTSLIAPHRLLLTTATSSTEDVAGHLTVLRLSGDERNLKAANAYVELDGPAAEVTAVAHDIDLALSTRTTVNLI